MPIYHRLGLAIIARVVTGINQKRLMKIWPFVGVVLVLVLTIFRTKRGRRQRVYRRRKTRGFIKSVFVTLTRAVGNTSCGNIEWSKEGGKGLYGLGQYLSFFKW